MMITGEELGQSSTVIYSRYTGIRKGSYYRPCLMPSLSRPTGSSHELTPMLSKTVIFTSYHLQMLHSKESVTW